MSATLDLSTTFGAFLVCVVVSAALFGVIGVQTFYYFQNYSSDRRFVKIVVLTLLILELLYTIFNTHAIYYYAIVNLNNPPALLDSIWSLTLTLGVSCVVTSIVHMFYIRRVYYMSHKNIVLVSLIAFLTLARFGITVAMIVKAFQLKHFSASTRLSPYVDSALSLSMATDIIIAASLSFYLHRSRSGIRNTDTMINRLMMYAINNGILTSIFDILIIILITSQPENLLFLSVYQVLGKLYSNSMLATLNSRRSMTQAGENIGISFRLPMSMPSTNQPVDTKPVDVLTSMDDAEHRPTSQMHDSNHFTNSAISLS